MADNENGGAQLSQARSETRASFENRAIVYAYILDELEAEIGLDEAIDVMKRAIYRRGVEIGMRYRSAAEKGDLSEVGRLFVEGSPNGGTLFEPAIDEPESDGVIVLRMTACPLVSAWRAAGYDAERIDLLCEIAAAVDYGTFAGAGLQLRFLDRQACLGSDRCLLELRLKP